MTIRQLAKAPLQGLVILCEYDDGKDATTFPWKSDPTCNMVNFPKEFWHREIENIFPATVDDYSALMVEIAPKKDAAFCACDD